jgi:hypothetical protein
MAERKIGKNTGNAGKGRPKGAPNKTTATLKQAILAAAEQTGQDGAGKDGLTGYLKHVAASDVKAFASLLGRVLPTELTGADGGPIETDNTHNGAVSISETSAFITHTLGDGEDRPPPKSRTH